MSDAKTVTLPLVWVDDKLYIGQFLIGTVFHGALTKKWWVSALVGPAAEHPTRASAQQALEDAVGAMGVEAALDTWHGNQDWLDGAPQTTDDRYARMRAVLEAAGRAIS
jgi:hypothetical protein